MTRRDEFGNADIIGVNGADPQGKLRYVEFNRATAALDRLATYEELDDGLYVVGSLGLIRGSEAMPPTAAAMSRAYQMPEK